MEIIRPLSTQPLPEHANCVFKGEIFDVYQWEQELYDGTIVIFEKVKRADTVIVFPVLDNGNILLTKQEQPGKLPFIGAPGGRVDPGEDILVAAKRELLEETGCEASEYELYKAIQPASKIEWAVYVFIAKQVKKVSDLNLDGGEKIELAEYGFEDFLEVASGPNFDGHEISYDVFQAKLDPAAKQLLAKRFSI
jgi:ADP-ribose pyrophosphatase